ncbi:MAG TPA: TIM barrel protein [Candidatus Thermoplasmatota archaeon]|nr:TIM barrel protein [Candidatus Thermoplasmatota archaeon]
MRLGVKVHWRDVDAMARLAERQGATVLEYQMLPGDLEEHAQRAMDAFLPYRGRFELRVHQPEGYLHAGRPRFLDISSPDPEERGRSLRVLAEVARHAMELRAKALVIHPGGIWRPGEVGGSPELLRASLLDLPKHVPLLLENMPELYNLDALGLDVGWSPAAFRIPAGLRAVDDLVDGYVLDVSHAYLAVPQGSLAVVRAFLRDLGPRIAHVHANGARGGMGVHGEGTPFDDSDYGADVLREVLAAVSPQAVVVPEVKDGHLDGGRAFDAGLAFLKGLR